MKIAIASDHGGFELKQRLQAAFAAEWTDFGCTGKESCDYPDYADAVAEAVAKGEVALLDVSDSIIISTGPQIAALGVKDLVVVATGRSVLVAERSRVQDLKKLLAKLNANGA